MCFINSTPKQIILQLATKTTLTLHRVLFTFPDYTVHGEVVNIVEFSSAVNTWASTGGKQDSLVFIHWNETLVRQCFSWLITQEVSPIANYKRVLLHAPLGLQPGRSILATESRHPPSPPQSGSAPSIYFFLLQFHIDTLCQSHMFRSYPHCSLLLHSCNR